MTDHAPENRLHSFSKSGSYTNHTNYRPRSTSRSFSNQIRSSRDRGRHNVDLPGRFGNAYREEIIVLIIQIAKTVKAILVIKTLATILNFERLFKKETIPSSLTFYQCKLCDKTHLTWYTLQHKAIKHKILKTYQNIKSYKRSQ